MSKNHNSNSEFTVIENFDVEKKPNLEKKIRKKFQFLHFLKMSNNIKLSIKTYNLKFGLSIIKLIIKLMN